MAITPVTDPQNSLDVRPIERPRRPRLGRREQPPEDAPRRRRNAPREAPEDSREERRLDVLG